MNSSESAINSAIAELDTLKKKIGKRKTKQISLVDERSLMKAIAQTWFSSHRQHLLIIEKKSIDLVDSSYQLFLKASEKSVARKPFLKSLKETKNSLVDLRSAYATALSSPQSQVTSDQIPSFSVLVSDQKMQEILGKRWTECSNCILANAPLAATVMIGGLLEALLLARINQAPDKSKVFGAGKAPKDRKTGKVLQLKDWGLKNYIEVAHELKWISHPTMALSDVLRDYRNFIHPHKEHVLGVSLVVDDAKMFWEISKNIARQLLNP